MPFNIGQRAKWYKYYSEKFGVSEDRLKREFEKELSGGTEIDDPLEIPDKMEIIFKYSYGEQSRFFRELRENKRIMGAKCVKCGQVYCPPRGDCHLCYEPTEWVELSGKGTIVSHTVQYVTASALVRKTPFICCYVQLDGADTLLMTNLEMDDVEKCQKGMRVVAHFRHDRHGDINDFYFKVAK
ncbi:MAG: Zn-ribbon domain-containing OB-fold protein [bacterium]